MPTAVPAPTRPRPERRARHGLRRSVWIAVGLVMVALGLNSWVVYAETREAEGGHLVRLAGGDLSAVEQGPADAPAVVLLHGTAGSTSWWDPVMEDLVDVRVVRIDLLGHGASAKPRAGYGIAEQARRVASALDELGITGATVVGHSTGGAVAISLAEQRRDLVSRLGLIDSGPQADAYQGGGAISALTQAPIVGQVLWRMRSDARIRSALESAWVREVDVPEQIVADVRAMTYTAFAATTQASLDFLEAKPLPARLKDIGVPALVIYGAEDERWTPAAFDAYRDVAGAQVEELDGVGHTPMLEDPQTTGSLIRDFVGDGNEES